MDETNRLLMHTYSRFPVALEKGRGMRAWSLDGKEYLDFLAGIAVNALGHCHPRVVVAIQKQAQRLLHVSNLYYIPGQVELARILVENSCADKVFFCNSGAESVESAIKLARKHARNRGDDERYEIVCASNSFHGRTMGALSATGQEKYHRGFGPLLQGFRHVPFGNIDAMRKEIGPKTCGVLLEPIQGEGGIQVPSEGYLKRVRDLCTERNVPLIFDEVQTGVGRTGHLFAYQYFGVKPDILCLAKGLGGGFPIGAMLAIDEIAQAFAPGSHASTFGGNPLAVSAAIATLETILEDGLILDGVERMGTYLKNTLEIVRKKFSTIVKDVRGVGLMVGMEVSVDPAVIVKAALQRGLLVGSAGANVVRFTPPLIVNERDIDAMAAIIDNVLKEVAF